MSAERTIAALIEARVLERGGIMLQQFGRAIRGRLVHAKRARKLRRRGEVVRFWGYNDAGRAMCRWMRRPAIVDFVRPTIAITDEANIFDPPTRFFARK